jgi:hypothetical protein
MIQTINNQGQKSRQEVKNKEYPNHALLQLLLVPTTKSKVRVLTVVSRTLVLSNLSKESRVSTTMTMNP